MTSKTRGILRESSFRSSSSNQDSDCSPNSEESSSRKLKMSSLPTKPERRNVGKVVRSRPSDSSKGEPRRGVARNISFSEKNQVCEVPTLDRSRSAEFFYDDDEIAKFRNDAFLESCGLDPADFEHL